MTVSNVYFSNLKSIKKSQNKSNKIKNLFMKLNIKNIINKDDITAIKVHFGEEGNDTYINPIYVRTIVDILKEIGSNPFVTDTVTLYNGSRSNLPDHLEIALKHGFNYTVLNAPISIADGLRGKSENKIEINKKHFKHIKIGHDIYESDNMILLSHFKGHSMAGFGGALKNLAMGCASKSGKYEQHASAKPKIIVDKCIKCKKCVSECPTGSIIEISDDNKNKIFSINKNTCTSCGYCLICTSKAIIYDYSNIKDFIEKMMEYSYGVSLQKKNKIGYINFLLNITPDCDCVSWSDEVIVSDIGILASDDPVAIDQACYDLVKKSIDNMNNNKNNSNKLDIGLDNKYDGKYQLYYAEYLGIGSRDYKLIEV